MIYSYGQSDRLRIFEVIFGGKVQLYTLNSDKHGINPLEKIDKSLGICCLCEMLQMTVISLKKLFHFVICFQFSQVGSKLWRALKLGQSLVFPVPYKAGRLIPGQGRIYAEFISLSRDVSYNILLVLCILLHLCALFSCF